MPSPVFRILITTDPLKVEEVWEDGSNTQLPEDTPGPSVEPGFDVARIPAPDFWAVVELKNGQPTGRWWNRPASVPQDPPLEVTFNTQVWKVLNVKTQNRNWQHGSGSVPSYSSYLRVEFSGEIQATVEDAQRACWYVVSGGRAWRYCP